MATAGRSRTGCPIRMALIVREKRLCSGEGYANEAVRTRYGLGGSGERSFGMTIVPSLRLSSRRGQGGPGGAPGVPGNPGPTPGIPTPIPMPPGGPTTGGKKGGGKKGGPITHGGGAPAPRGGSWGWRAPGSPAPSGPAAPAPRQPIDVPRFIKPEREPDGPSTGPGGWLPPPVVPGPSAPPWVGQGSGKGGWFRSGDRLLRGHSLNRPVAMFEAFSKEKGKFPRLGSLMSIGPKYRINHQPHPWSGTDGDQTFPGVKTVSASGSLIDATGGGSFEGSIVGELRQAAGALVAWLKDFSRGGKQGLASGLGASGGVISSGQTDSFGGY